MGVAVNVSPLPFRLPGFNAAVEAALLDPRQDAVSPGMKLTEREPHGRG
jgi:hypothetical protein